MGGLCLLRLPRLLEILCVCVCVCVQFRVFDWLCMADNLIGESFESEMRRTSV